MAGETSALMLRARIQGVGAAPYLGVVATKGMVPSNSLSSGVGTTLMSRSMHYAREALTSVKLLVPNFKVDAGATQAEIGLGSAATVTASIEYPAGTFKQVKFSGIAAGTVPNGGMLLSDGVAVSIPKDAQFWVRMYSVNASGVLLDGFGTLFDPANGDACNLFDGDRTMSSTVDSQFAGYTLAPLAVLGMTVRPSVLLIGTSRTAGHRDTPDSSGDTGVQARSVGPAYGYINAGINSDSMVSFIASHTNRLALGQYVNRIGIEMGTNDGGLSEGTKEADLQTILGYYAGKKSVAFTVDPVTSSTDSWATLANQTITTNFTTYNTYLKTLTGTADIAGVTGSQSANKWNVDGTAGKWVSTADGAGTGVHETQFANLAIQTALQAQIQAALA